MAEEPIHVKAPLSEDPEKRSIPFLISRLIDQKGGFRNVSEESLEAEIQAGSTGSSPVGDAESSSDEAEEEKSRPEQLQEARAKLAELAMEAYNESAQALDMVSLLMSKSQPAHAEPTISPYIKAKLPLGCLGVEAVQAAPITEQKSQDDKAVSLGWKLQALNSSADELLKSASRLQDEVRKETAYWEQASSIKDKGWSVCRLPRERHMLGVRYGFLEAAPSFRDKGLAAVRSRDSGGLELDLGLSEESTTQRIRARILQGDCTIAISPADSHPPPQDQSMEESILAARDGVFDAELFHEILKEGRSLMSLGVKFPDAGMSLPLSRDKTILLELLDSDASDADVKVEGPDKRYEKLAQLAVLALRISLCHAHQQRYNRRMATPPPLTAQKEQETSTPVLLPLILQLLQASILRSCRVFIDDVTSIYSSAGLTLHTTHGSNAYGFPRLDSLQRNEDVPLVEAMLARICEPLHTEINITAPSKNMSLVVDVHTSEHGTSFTVDVSPSSAQAKQERETRREIFWAFDEMAGFLCHHLALDLLDDVKSTNPAWVQRPLQELRLSAVSAREKRHSMAVELNHKRLVLVSTIWSEDTPQEEERTWFGGESSGENKKGFYESVAEINERMPRQA